MLLELRLDEMRNRHEAEFPGLVDSDACRLEAATSHADGGVADPASVGMLLLVAMGAKPVSHLVDLLERDAVAKLQARLAKLPGCGAALGALGLAGARLRVVTLAASLAVWLLAERLLAAEVARDAKRPVIHGVASLRGACPDLLDLLEPRGRDFLTSDLRKLQKPRSCATANADRS